MTGVGRPPGNYFHKKKMFFSWIWNYWWEEFIVPVGGKVLESENIQYADGTRLNVVWFANGTVQFVDDPDK